MSTTSQEVTKQEGRQPEEQQGAQRPMAIRPPVDVYENDTSITVTADLPGVTKDRLTLRVEGETLSFEGEAALATPEGTQAMYAELRTPTLRRSFTLSRELDSDKISAALRDGVLTLTIPKRAEAQPRKIEIQTG